MGSIEYDALMERTRLRSQASSALQSIQDTLLKIQSSNSPKLSVIAQKFLMQGVLARYLSVEEDWRWLLFNLTIDRKVALSSKEGRAASLHINSLYLHMQGILDNFAWLFIHQCKSEVAATINRTKVFLYSKDILNILPEGHEKDKLISFSDWYKDMCKKRHPVAHRLPLHIPSAILVSQDEVEQKHSLERQYSENINQFAVESKEALSTDPNTLDIHGLTKRAESANERISRYEARQRKIESEIKELGTFVPGFMYPEENKLYPLYPIVAEDIINLDIITNECLSIIHKICS